MDELVKRRISGVFDHWRNEAAASLRDCSDYAGNRYLRNPPGGGNGLLIQLGRIGKFK